MTEMTQHRKKEGRRSLDDDVPLARKVTPKIHQDSSQRPIMMRVTSTYAESHLVAAHFFKDHLFTN